MKKITLLIVFLSGFVLSQNNIENDYLIVKKDSTSFYTFTKKGAYISTITQSNEINYMFKMYSKSLPKPLEQIDFMSLSTVVSEESVYFLYPGGGIVYKYNDNEIQRIDDSFAHRNQFSGFFFEYNNELYLLGGYGYWDAKSYLTKFDFQSGSWNKVSLRGSPPNSGINQGSFVKQGNSIYVFDFFSKNSFENTEKRDKSVYKILLPEMTWEKQGRLLNFNEDKTIEDEIRATKIVVDGGLIVKYQNENFLKIKNPDRNQVLVLTANGKMPEFGENAVILDSTLIFGSKSADNTTHSIVSVDLKKFKVSDTNQLVLDDNQMFKFYMIFVFVFLVLFIIATFTYFKNQSTVFYISDNAIRNEKGTLILTKDESKVLKMFINSDEVENVFMLKLFADKSKSTDSTIKKKNKIIKDFNLRFFNYFGQNLILKKVSESDSRQALYTLAHKTNIIAEKVR